MTQINAELLSRRQALLGAAYQLFYESPVHLVRGEGVWLYDDDGRKYLDMYNNVPHVGHCHPHVVDAISRQAGTLKVARSTDGNHYRYWDRRQNFSANRAADVDILSLNSYGIQISCYAGRVTLP